MSQLLTFPSPAPVVRADIAMAVLIDQWLPVLDHYELRCLLYVARHTAGRGKAQDAIALSQFASGIVRSDGTAQDGGTGLDLRGVRRGLAGLERRGLIRIHRSKVHGTHANATNVYILNLDPNAVLLTPLDTVLVQPDPWGDSAPTSVAPPPVMQEVALGSDLPLTDQDQELKERKKENACAHEGKISERGVYPETPHNIPQVSESNPDAPFEVWWLNAVAAHNRQQCRTRLTDTDAATLACWRSFGLSDGLIRTTLTRLLAEDAKGRIYALAYCHHAIMTSAGSPNTTAKKTDMFKGSAQEHRTPAQMLWWQRNNYTTHPLQLEGSTISENSGKSPHPSGQPTATPNNVIPVPPTPVPNVVSSVVSFVAENATQGAGDSKRTTCSKCWQSFASSDDDPCLRKMSLYDRRTWGATHMARYHRAMPHTFVASSSSTRIG